MNRPLGWFGIARLGLVQAALGAVVVLATATLNRVMVVELALPAVVPGALIALHYAVQLLRPRWGHGSDGSGRRTPWIAGGMAVLALGGTGAAAAVALMASAPRLGFALALLAFTAIGLGVGAAGTSLLVLAATRVAPARRPAAASLIWIMMIAGFAVTAGLAGNALDPFSPARLVGVIATACGAALLLSLLALWGVEGRGAAAGDAPPRPAAPRQTFAATLREVWAEPTARRFTLFVFVSMLAYSAQDLVLEPFAGRLLGLTPGETTRLSGVQHGGVLVGMLIVAALGGLFARRHPGFMRGCTLAGCALSALVLCGLAAAGGVGPSWPLRPSVFLLGVGNGVFAVAAIGAMMALAGRGARAREGVRMGLFGAAQALAFGLGSLAGTAAVDAARHLFASPAAAYGSVFLLQAALFGLAARLAVRATAPAGTGAEREAPLGAVLPA